MDYLQKCKKDLIECFGGSIEVKIIDENSMHVKAFTEDKTSWIFLSSISSAFKELGLEIIGETCGVSAYLFETKIKEV